MSGDNLFARLVPHFRSPLNLEERIISIKFSHDGENLVAASNINTIDLFDCNTNQQVGYFDLKKHGISVIDYMDLNKILVGSKCATATRDDYDVRELDMQNNRFVTCYNGHKQPSVSLAVNPEKQFFISGGLDKSARLFDFRMRCAQISNLDLPAVPLVALHPATELCAFALENNRIELYDVRGLNKGPFTVFEFNEEPNKWTSLKFSPNGDKMLICTDSTRMSVINSFDGRVDSCMSRRNELHIPIDASFSAQSDHILTGTSNGNVIIFNSDMKSDLKDANEPEHVLKSMRPEAITAVEMNPKYALMVTASSYVAFWAPSDQVEGEHN